MRQRFLALAFFLFASLIFFPALASADITGTNGNDTLTGTPGNDLIITGLGSDNVDGGAGSDAVRLPFFPNKYQFSQTAAHQNTARYLGYTTILNNVEYVEFGTSSKTLLPMDIMLSGNVQTRLAQLTDLYLAFFGRAPEVSGLEYWQKQHFEEGKDFLAISKDFAWSEEAQRLFPKNASNREFVQSIYRNCFGRDPDPGGWDYWTRKLDGLGTTDLNDRGAIVGELILGAYAPTSGADDRTLLTNRHDVALHYVNCLSAESAESFDNTINALLSLVTGDPATRDKARHVIDHVFANPLTLAEVMNDANLLDALWAWEGNSGEVEDGGALVAFASGLELEKYLKDGLAASAGNRDLYHYAEFLKAAEDAALPVLANATQPARYSTTNLQEAGVDEADVIKSDGVYLYLAPVEEPSRYYATDLIPAEAAASGEVKGVDTIRIMALDEQPARARQVAAISLESFANKVDGLYLLTQRDGNYPDLLVTVGASQRNPWEIWSCPWCWQNTRTEIGLFDVSVPETPQPAERISLDGQLLASRRIGELLYLVTRYTPVPRNFNLYPSTPLEQASNEAILKKAILADLLPAIRVGDAAAAAMVTAETTYLPPHDADRLAEPTLITITAIDLRDPLRRFAAAMVGPAETAYVSPDSLYVATTRDSSRMLISAVDMAMASLTAAPAETTDVHKFRLTVSGPVYRGSGTVIGNLGWEASKRAFRMGEYGDVLRVATSLGETWNDTSTTRLTLMMEKDDGIFAETAHVDNIGELGERLYAVRYTGSRAYLVTFRVTDPLYVFDLADPYQPSKAGELHIQGYSDYLHPVSETRLLGIGKDAVADDVSTDFGGRGAWYQGVKLSLFDVADPSSPVELSTVVIGKRGTESDALVDHHAVTFLPAAPGTPARLALPLQKHETLNVGGQVGPSTWYDWTHTGLYMFSITSESIELAGNLIVADRSAGDPAPYGAYGLDRSVIVNDSIHYIHTGSVWSATWGNPATVTAAQ